MDESVINFKDTTNTIQHSASSYTDWIKDNGTIDTMLNYQIALGLGLISSV